MIDGPGPEFVAKLEGADPPDPLVQGSDFMPPPRELHLWSARHPLPQNGTTIEFLKQEGPRYKVFDSSEHSDVSNIASF